jgi:sterol desaturase/sphingolipid hydroxylase (fatty acid hydroxylase superfamily)
VNILRSPYYNSVPIILQNFEKATRPTVSASIYLKFAGRVAFRQQLSGAAKGMLRAMTAEWLQRYVTWFGSTTNIAWFVGFWLFISFIFGLETWVPAFQQQPERAYRWPTNFGLGLINWGLAAMAPISAISAAEWASRTGVGVFNQVAMPLWVSMCGSLAVYSLTGYLVHLVEHKSPWLWRIHRVHHLDTHLDVSTSQRHHPLELIANVLIVVAVTIVFGLTASLLIIYETMNVIIDFFSHANVRLPESLDRIVRWVLVTPNMHSLHHSSHRPETDSNYGVVFTVWDRLFGTYRAEPAWGYGKLQIGLQEIRDDRAWNFWWQMKSPALPLKDQRSF